MKIDRNVDLGVLFMPPFLTLWTYCGGMDH